MMDFSVWRDENQASAYLDSIRRTLAGRTARFMEVCGGHTMAIWRHGLPTLLGEQVTLLSGPGCPVCVTPNSFLDRAFALSRRPDVTLVTFGDLMRVPGSTSDLLTEKSRGADIRVVYSARDALPLARSLPKRTVIFLGIGFETTAPTVAAMLDSAESETLSNLRLLSALKTMPQALRAVASGGDVRLDGLILPGHVSAITGSGIYEFLPREFHLPCAISGFEPLDILQSLDKLARQMVEGRAEVEIQYSRAVKPAGNPQAQSFMNRFFEPCETEWRGLGKISDSGLQLRPEYKQFDALQIEVQVEAAQEHPGCLCGDVIRGASEPEACSLFASACRPESPLGACMVSEEGTCAAHFRYAARA